jgi:hypothetical protein
VGSAPADHILELEMHGPFVTLRPGESMRFEQTAEVRPYDGPEDPDAHVSFLRALGRAHVG